MRTRACRARSAERRRAQERLSVQHAVAQVAAQQVSLAEAAPHFLQAICEHLDWQLGELWTVDPVGKVMRLASRWYPHQGTDAVSPGITGFVADSLGWTFPKGEGLPGRVWQDGAPAWEHDLEGSTVFLRTEAARRAGLHRVFAFPLRDGGENEGAGVMVFLGKETGAPDPELVVTMNTLAGQIAQFTERCRAETSLRASQTRFTAFMEHAPGRRLHQGRGGPFPLWQPDAAGPVRDAPGGLARQDGRGPLAGRGPRPPRA